tara:strand:- start:389 stop:820 length:432 start_codon:yes stop_codon:yes gene_type:complete
MLFLTLLTLTYISYLIIKDKTIVNRSISFSYYEGVETDVLWGSFASIVGVTLWFLFPDLLPRIASVSLVLVPIFGNFQQKPITYFHYAFAVIFFGLMLYYTGWPFFVGVGGVLLSIILKKKLSIFWYEVIGIILILAGLFTKM